MVSEIAFVFLKSRFRILCRKCEAHEDTVNIMALACIILHNICIHFGDLVPRKYYLRLNLDQNKICGNNLVQYIF